MTEGKDTRKRNGVVSRGLRASIRRTWRQNVLLSERRPREEEFNRYLHKINGNTVLLGCSDREANRPRDLSSPSRPGEGSKIPKGILEMEKRKGRRG